MKQKIVCVAGFGDNGSLFEPLLTTALATEYTLLPFNLPGFGAPPLAGMVTLERMATSLQEYCTSEHATIVLAHSVASIITSLAAQQPSSSIQVILSLEGNLTSEDAYFSGTASNYPDPLSFRTAFLERLDERVPEQPIIARYRAVVATSDPQALWELGNDAFRFSQKHVPGLVLMQAAQAVYVYNPINLPPTSIKWLSTHALPQVVLEGASHWPSIDQPDLLATKLQEAISLVS